MPRSLRQRFFGTISKSIWWMEFVFSSQCCLLSASLPKKLDYWLSLLAAEVYSFITIFVGNLGTISKLYPLVAAFTLSGYYESTPGGLVECDFDGFVRYDIRHTDLSAEQKRRFAVKLWHQVLSEA